jgi:mannose-6-phosphate isomerase-like protein (cupin superfamily)
LRRAAGATGGGGRSRRGLDFSEEAIMGPKNYAVIDLAGQPGNACLCGTSRRAPLGEAGFPFSVHQTTISVDAVAHSHHQTTEAYYILECEPDAAMELDGQRIPVKQGMLIGLKPGCVHRAIGTMTVLIVVHPRHNGDDEFPA